MPEGGGKGKHEKVTLTAAQKAAQNAEELRTPNSVSADMMSQAHETKHGGESEDENASPKELSGKEKLGQMIGAALSAAINYRHRPSAVRWLMASAHTACSSGYSCPQPTEADSRAERERPL